MWKRVDPLLMQVRDKLLFAIPASPTIIDYRKR